MIKVLKENNYFSNNEDVERILRDMKYKDSNEKAVTSNNVFDGYSKALPTPNDGRYLYGFNLSDAVDAIEVYYGYKNRREAFDAIKDVSEEDLNKAMAYMIKKDIPFTFESVENDYVESGHSKQELNEDIKDYIDKLSVNYMGKIFNQMRKDGWDGSQETADSYFDAIMKKIDPNYKSDNDLVRESKPLKEEDEEVTSLVDEEPEVETDEESEVEEVENEDGNKTILDYLLDRIGEEMTVGELNTVLQSLFGKYNTVFITLDTIYNQDPEEEQELIVWDDEDMYTITYNITDVLQPIIEIDNVTLE